MKAWLIFLLKHLIHPADAYMGTFSNLALSKTINELASHTYPPRTWDEAYAFFFAGQLSYKALVRRTPAIVLFYVLSPRIVTATAVSHTVLGVMSTPPGCFGGF